MIIWGTRLFGKVDAVPGLGYVATKFGHINFVPLIPLESWLVMSEEGNGWRGQAIPFSWKSVLVAWGRVALIVASVVTFFAGLGRHGGNGLHASWPVWMLTLLCIAAIIASYFWAGIAKASPERALEIARQAGVPESSLDALRRAAEAPIAAAVPAQPWTPPES
ncbi:hypothetical protein [Comamonas sp. JC664]|uniref:hypothetical protein n=1 Tax=Comamonas sp. JC664 TaxID=2801917 RepID=UPI00191EE708|nr:hypothetical protein [Comamonas sp. JC664]MBL0695919.1 hypothetical protein [Comamonas sp. JC664]